MKTDKTFLNVRVTLLVLAAVFCVFDRIAGRGTIHAQSANPSTAANKKDQGVTGKLKALATAMANEDAAAIREAVQQARAALGDKAGVPEVPDEYLPVPATAKVLTPVEARQGMSPHFKRLEQLRYWKIGIDPTQLTGPLREPAVVIACMSAVARAKLDGADKALGLACEAADFLIWAQQQQGGAGCYPFPAAKSTSSARAMQAATQFLERAEAAGILDKTVRNGWAYEDHGDGGLQFDNGECGIALFELFELTQDPRYLDSARRAADWALTRPLCTNWNYNSFSVHLLAKAYDVTQKPEYRDAALKKALLGVIPGQLVDGPRSGRWVDAHNARPAYHYIMLAALAQLAAIMPTEHPDRAAVIQSLKIGLKCRNSEILTQGVMTKDKAIECLLLVQSLFEQNAKFLKETDSTSALEVLCRLASEQARRGRLPLRPRGWGEMLVMLAGRDP